jgi:hypothetical protein
MVSLSYAGGERYFIKFGSFKNLKGVERTINKMPKSLRSHVNIIYSKGWYIPFAYYKKSKNGLSSKVKLYKRYFSDADVTHGRRMFANRVIYKFGKRVKSRSIRKLKRTSRVKKRVKSAGVVTLQNVAISSDDNRLNIPIQNYSSQNIPSILEALPDSSTLASSEKLEQRSYKSFTKQMLSGNHYYMTYKAPKGGTNLLIKVSFGADDVSYQPVIGDMQMTQAHYLVDNNRLYMFAESFSKDGAYSILDEHQKDYFLVSSWMDKKRLNRLRYYYKLNDAKKYLGEDISNGLSEVLQEGNFDEFFLNEEDY